MRIKYSNIIGPIFGVLFILSCQSTGEQNREDILSLAEMSREIECQMAALEAQSEKMWDKTNSELAKALPADVEEYEKNNMLKVRNADLIRMFESYSKLDGPIKSKVDFTEKMDFAMADSMRVLQQKQKILIDSVRSQMMKVESDEKRNSLKEQMNRIENTDCTKIFDHD